MGGGGGSFAEFFIFFNPLLSQRRMRDESLLRLAAPRLRRLAPPRGSMFFGAARCFGGILKRAKGRNNYTSWEWKIHDCFFSEDPQSFADVSSKICEFSGHENAKRIIL